MEDWVTGRMWVLVDVRVNKRNIESEEECEWE